MNALLALAALSVAVAAAPPIADADPASNWLSWVIFAVLTGVGNYITERRLRTKAKADKGEVIQEVSGAAAKAETAAVKAEAAVQTAVTTAAEAKQAVITTVEASLNGDGLGGRMRVLEGRMTGLERALLDVPAKAAVAAVTALRAELAKRPDGDARPPAGG